MSHLKEKLFVRCPLNQAPRYVKNFLESHRSAAGAPFRIELRAPIEALGLKTELSREVTVKVSDMTTAANDLELEVEWEPTGGGPFPSFKGRLRVAPDEDYNTCVLVLEGDYEAPFGAAGAAFDAAIGAKLAGATARELLNRIGQALEAAYDATEAAKPKQTA